MAMTNAETGRRPRIAQVGAIALGTPDIDESLRFFRDLLGMEEVRRDGSASYLRGYQELKHHSLVLFESDEPIVDSYCLRTERPEHVEQFADILREQGVEVLELAPGHQAGRGAAIRFLHPHSRHPFEIYYDIEAPEAPDGIRSLLPSNSSKRRGLGVRRIDHINLATAVEQVGDAELWLRETLGFRRRESMSHDGTLLSSWLAVTPQVHDIAIGAGVNNEEAQLHHVAFNLENQSDVLVAADTLRDHGVAINAGPGKHGISQGMFLYVRDPGSGHCVEIFAGGYLIFDPDWKSIDWDMEAVLSHGLSWYGDPLDTPEGSALSVTTPSSGLQSRLGSLARG